VVRHDIYQLLLIEHSQHCFISFRGTTNLSEVATDLAMAQVEFYRGGKVHSGFAEAWGLILYTNEREYKELSKENDYILTGHSLGGMSSMDFKWNRQVKSVLPVTFGQPAVCDKVIAGIIKEETWTYYRVKNKADFVTYVPPSHKKGEYWQAGRKIQFNSKAWWGKYKWDGGALDGLPLNPIKTYTTSWLVFEISLTIGIKCFRINILLCIVEAIFNNAHDLDNQYVYFVKYNLERFFPNHPKP